MRTSAPFLDLGYAKPDAPRQPRGAASTPVSYHRAPGDRSAGAAALREMRRQLDHAHGMLTDGTRRGDDPFARRQLEEAYERLKTALFLYNQHATALGVPEAQAFIGDVPVIPPAPRVSKTPSEAQNRPAKPLPTKAEARTPSKELGAAELAAIEQARAAFFAKGRS